MVGGRSCGLIRIKAIFRCSCFDLPKALSPPACPALNCNDGNGEQEPRSFYLFIFLVIFFFYFYIYSSISEHFIILRAFHRERCKFVRSCVWIFTPQWIFLLWPHQKKPKQKPNQKTNKQKKWCFACYVGCSPVILFSWIFSPPCHVTLVARAQGHRDIPPSPQGRTCPLRLWSLSLLLAPQHQRGRVIHRAGGGIKRCEVHS